MWLVQCSCIVASKYQYQYHKVGADGDEDISAVPVKTQLRAGVSFIRNVEG